jgi:hypothetical protein
MGWMTGLEPATAGTTIQCSTIELHPPFRCTELLDSIAYLNLSLPDNTCAASCYLARLKGLEPLANCLEGSCSIHLSYRRKAKQKVKMKI